MNIIKSIKFLTPVTVLCAAMLTSSFSSIATEFDSDDGVASFQQKEGNRGAHHFKRFAKMLALTSEQQAQIQAIKSEAKEKSASLHESLKAFKEQAKALIQAESFDEQAFIALQEANQSTFEQAGLLKAKTKNAIYNVLTPEQQDKWEKVEKKINRKSHKKH